MRTILGVSTCTVPCISHAISPATRKATTTAVIAAAAATRLPLLLVEAWTWAPAIEGPWDHHHRHHHYHHLYRRVIIQRLNCFDPRKSQSWPSDTLMPLTNAVTKGTGQAFPHARMSIALPWRYSARRRKPSKTHGLTPIRTKNQHKLDILSVTKTRFSLVSQQPPLAAHAFVKHGVCNL